MSGLNDTPLVSIFGGSIAFTKTDDFRMNRDSRPRKIAIGSNEDFERGAQLGRKLNSHPVLKWPLRMLLYPLLLIRNFFAKRFHRKFFALTGDPRIFGYFVYAEDHQLKYFFGSKGRLKEFERNFLIRNWRAEMHPVESDLASWKAFYRTFDGEVLRKYRLSNMKEHLPFLLIFTEPLLSESYHLNGPYRKRLKDENKTLIQISENIREMCTYARYRANNLAIQEVKTTGKDALWDSFPGE